MLLLLVDSLQSVFLFCKIFEHFILRPEVYACFVHYSYIDVGWDYVLFVS